MQDINQIRFADLLNLSRVERDLIDIANDFDAPGIAHWVRGQDWNTGDRGVERCRLKLLNVESQNVPKEMTMLAPASSS